MNYFSWHYLIKKIFKYIERVREGNIDTYKENVKFEIVENMII